MRKRQIQTTFLKKLGYSHEAAHGGALTLGLRKVHRPLDPKKPLHLILKSSRARGEWSLLRHRNRNWVERLISMKAKHFGVQVRGFVNVGNHLHLKLKIRDRAGFQKFLKSVTTQIARHVTGARRGAPKGKFWDALAFTKVIRVWRQEQVLDRYLHANQVEVWHGRAIREEELAAQSRAGPIVEFD